MLQPLEVYSYFRKLLMYKWIKISDVDYMLITYMLLLLTNNILKTTGKYRVRKIFETRVK